MFTLRRATPSDIEALIPLAQATFRDGWAQAVGEELVEGYIREKITVARFREDMSRVGALYFVALDSNDSLVGYAVMNLSKPSPPNLPTPATLLQRLYVATSARGSGVADQLLERCEQEARAVGAVFLWLECDPRNPRAWYFYLKRGFVDSGPSPYPIPGDPCNTVRYMTRAIKTDSF
jgi:diamine N-acetyltransferase